MEVFGDTWRWANAALDWDNFPELCPSPRVQDLMEGFLKMLGHNDVSAYLVMMAPRLFHLHRVLKPTGSLYLHCDPTAAAYLKILLDAIFGPKNFRNEIVWKRSSAHNDTAQGMKRYGRNHDVILYYAKSDNTTWNPSYTAYDDSYISGFYKHEDENGRLYRLSDMTGPGGAAKGNPSYEVMGVTRYWRYSKDRMNELIASGRVIQTKPGAVPQQKRYLDEMPGVSLQDIWIDVNPIGAQALERLGYPTQKPLALLERLINASSNPGDVVLDPFCVAGDTLITTRDGLQPIREVQEGDEVLTHEGRYRRVIRCCKRPYQGQMLTLFRSKSNVGLEITPNHPVLAIRAAACPYENRRCLPRSCRYHASGKHLDCINPKRDYKLEWIEAGELQEGDWVYFPQTSLVNAPLTLPLPQTGHFNAIPLPQSVPVTPELMEWIGYFAAEGFVDANTVHFTNYEDAERIAELGCRLFGLTAAVKQRPYLCKHFRFNSGALSRWMEAMIGRGASRKTLPDWIYGLSAPCRQGLLRGLLRGDGSFRKDKADDLSHSYRYSSSSPTLAHQLYRLLMAEGVACGYNIVKLNRAPRTINGRVCQVNHDAHQIYVYDITSMNYLLRATQEAPTYQETITRKPYDTYPFENGWLYTLRKIERKEDVQMDVYNIKVEEDHSYVTATMAVHNCGCGTAVVAAQQLGRHWIGIDVTPIATSLIVDRLARMHCRDERVVKAGDADAARAFKVEGLPTDLPGAQKLFADNPKDFEMWAVSLIPVTPQDKKGADGGIDGIKDYFVGEKEPIRAVVQVKGGHVGAPQVQQLRGAMEKFGATLGLFLCLEAPTVKMHAEASHAGFYALPLSGKKIARLQIRTVGDLLDDNTFDLPSYAAPSQAVADAPQAIKQTGMDL